MPQPGACRAADLIGDADAHGFPSDRPEWTYVTTVHLTNHSRSDCSLTGWVDLRMVGFDYVCVPIDGKVPDRCPADHAAARRQTVTRVGPAPGPVVIPPGRYVAVLVYWSSTLAPACERLYEDPFVIEIRPPGDPDPVLVEPFLQPCDGDVGITAAHA